MRNSHLTSNYLAVSKVLVKTVGLAEYMRVLPLSPFSAPQLAQGCLSGESTDVLRLHPFHKRTSLVRPVLPLLCVYNDVSCIGTR